MFWLNFVRFKNVQIQLCTSPYAHTTRVAGGGKSCLVTFYYFVTPPKKRYALAKFIICDLNYEMKSYTITRNHPWICSSKAFLWFMTAMCGQNIFSHVGGGLFLHYTQCATIPFKVAFLFASTKIHMLFIAFLTNVLND